MNKREVLEILDECPPVSRLRQLFTPEQVRQWPDNTIELLMCFQHAKSSNITDIMHWMIEECGFSVHGNPCDIILSPRVINEESVSRIRLMLRHGAKFFYRSMFHITCGNSNDDNSNAIFHKVLLLLIDHEYEPNTKECWHSNCRIQTYYYLAKSRRFTHHCVIALLGARRTSPLARRWLPRDILRMIARMVWQRRWEFIDH